MRTLLVLAAGIWIGREIYTTLAKNQARESDVKIRKQLERFIRENMPDLQPDKMQIEIGKILK